MFCVCLASLHVCASPLALCLIYAHEIIFYHHQCSFFIFFPPTNLCFYSFFICSVRFCIRIRRRRCRRFFLLLLLYYLFCLLVHLFISFHILFYCKFSRFLCLIDSLTLILIPSLTLARCLRNDVEKERKRERERESDT